MRNNIFWSYAILWLILNAFSLYAQTKQTYEFVSELAYDQGKMFFDHIVSMRDWSAHHGGVYVPVTETTRPNPYLKIPFRDIKRPDGRQLTLINPAYMTRQLSEIDHDKTGIRFHITSLDPIRPKNKADRWEKKALHSFETGKPYAHGKSNIEEKPFFRYMEPLITKKSCLQCHAYQGYKIGDIRGGISVSIPTEKITIILDHRIQSIILIHGVICVIGLILLSVFQLSGQKITQRLDQAKGKVRLAYIDPLTKLPNRRHYDIFLRKEWNRAMRHHYPLSMIMIDIDFFKLYNDSLGHPEGDNCLKKVASILQKHFRRPDDLIARYGGEEFCVVASCDSNQINMLAETLRKAIQNTHITHPNSNVSGFVTISLGISTIFPNKNKRPTQLLDYADKALYIAKENGRNRVECYNNQQLEE